MPSWRRHVRAAASVCLVGQTIVRELFQNQSPLGKEIRIGSVRVRVIGVLARKGVNMMGRDQDDYILIPWTTVKFRISSARQAANPAAVTAVAQANNLNLLYPSQQAALYPQKSVVQLADMPFLVRFSDLDDIFVYLRARANDAVPRGRPQKREDKPKAAGEAESSCLGSSQ